MSKQDIIDINSDVEEEYETCSSDEQELEEHFLLRLPEKYARKMRKVMQKKSKNSQTAFKLKLNPVTREGELSYKNKSVSLVLLDLPTISETHKTTDKVLLYKTSDVSQILVPAKTIDAKHIQKKKYPRGLTPPMKNAKKRFRKTILHDSMNDFQDKTIIEKELRWLLKNDNEAMTVRWEVFDEVPKPKPKPNTTPAVITTSTTNISGNNDIFQDSYFIPFCILLVIFNFLLILISLANFLPMDNEFMNYMSVSVDDMWFPEKDVFGEFISESDADASDSNQFLLTDGNLVSLDSTK